MIEVTELRCVEDIATSVEHITMEKGPRGYIVTFDGDPSTQETFISYTRASMRILKYFISRIED